MVAISGRKANYLMGARSKTDLVTSNFQIDLNQDFQLSFITGYVDTTQPWALAKDPEQRFASVADESSASRWVSAATG